VILVWVTSKNLHGFLQITVLNPFRLQPGESYAITTVLRYCLVLVGMIVIANMLGMTWSKIHWLAAAITVGIGFGLQEIFGNFVSGLIILFERPVRRGDIVTVGDVSGVVTKIQIRATTLRDWENRELILPNKEFITGRFINWSLTDQVLRVVCRVGVSYEADVHKVHDLLVQLALNHPRVLKDPPPSALFSQFGDSTLNFDLRFYVSNADLRLQLQHEMNMAIIDAFRKAGIEIAFPQRDLHVRSLPAGLVANQNPQPTQGSQNDAPSPSDPAPTS